MGHSERGLALVKVAACGFKLPTMKTDNIVYKSLNKNTGKKVLWYQSLESNLAWMCSICISRRGIMASFDLVQSTRAPN